MKLFSYNDYKIDISPEAFALKAFKTIWQRDKSKGKDRAIQDFGVIYFMCDPRSSYMFYVDEFDRLGEIRKDEGLDKSWKLDSQIRDAMELYKKLTKTTGSVLLEKSKMAADRLADKLATINLDHVDAHGKPVYSISMITSALKQMPDVVKSLMDSERMVFQELEEKSNMRGNKEKKIGEDGILGFFGDDK